MAKKKGGGKKMGKNKKTKILNQKKAVVGLVGGLIFITGLFANGIFNNQSIINNNHTIAITQVITQIVNPSIKPKNIVWSETPEGKYQVIEVLDGDTVKLAT